MKQNYTSLFFTQNSGRRFKDARSDKNFSYKQQSGHSNE